jgi:hypothetical protein
MFEIPMFLVGTLLYEYELAVFDGLLFLLLCVSVGRYNNGAGGRGVAVPFHHYHGMGLYWVCDEQFEHGQARGA